MTPPLSLLLAVNWGSSSVKFALFRPASRPGPIIRGATSTVAPLEAAAEIAVRTAAELGGASPAGIGHRLVHGGPRYRAPQRITAAVIDDLRDLAPFAPNHLPQEIDLIDALIARYPDATHVACFDTAFHGDMPEIAWRLPLPRSYDAAGIRRYGFHGLSYTFVLSELERIAGANAARANLVLAHLGHGSSLAAVKDGRCIDTSMGLTPMGGVMMSTRSGDLDPGALIFIARTLGATPDELEAIVSRQSGLAGVSSKTGDMRELLAVEPEDEQARLAVAMYCYEIRKRIGAYAAALGGLDTLVFSGGVGERSAVIRERICRDLNFLGVQLDPDANADNRSVISRPDACITVRIVPTDEEYVIAESVHRLLI